MLTNKKLYYFCISIYIYLLPYNNNCMFLRWRDKHEIIPQSNKRHDLHAGRLDISADTAQGIPRFESAPLMIPQGK